MDLPPPRFRLLSPPPPPAPQSRTVSVFTDHFLCTHTHTHSNHEGGGRWFSVGAGRLRSHGGAGIRGRCRVAKEPSRPTRTARKHIHTRTLAWQPSIKGGWRRTARRHDKGLVASRVGKALLFVRTWCRAVPHATKPRTGSRLHSRCTASSRAGRVLSVCTPPRASCAILDKSGLHACPDDAPPCVRPAERKHGAWAVVAHGHALDQDLPWARPTRAQMAMRSSMVRAMAVDNKTRESRSRPRKFSN